MVPVAHPFLGNTPDRVKWLESRRLGIGASDVADLYGLGFKGRGPHTLYASKVDPIPDYEPLPERLRTGLELEPCIAARYEERTGFKVATNRGTLTSRKFPFVFASLDRVRTGDDGRAVELKAVFGPPGGSIDWEIDGDGWGNDGTDQVPMKVILQSQWQTGALDGPDYGDVAALFVGYEFRVYTVPFNPSLYAAMIEDAKEFWQHVLDRRPVDKDWRPSRLEDVKALGRKTIRGSETILGPDSLALIDQYKKSADMVKLYKASQDDAKTSLESLLGDYETAYAPDGSKICRVFVDARDVSYHQAASSHVRVYPKKGKKS